MSKEPRFYCCYKCGKRLIERKTNGTWRFIFGRKESRESPVVMEIHGHVKMRCIRRSCRRRFPNYWNIFNFLPNPIETIESTGEQITEKEVM